MSYARHRPKKEFPEEVFIVVWHTKGTHALYSTLSAAKGMVTREKRWARSPEAIPVIYRISLFDMEKVEYG